jgi:rod shape-determining protein MreD
VKTAWVLLATAVAVAAQTTLNRWFPGGVVDLVLVVVVFTALTTGRVSGMWAGTVAGLMQDAMSGGVIGMAGLSKTVVGFLAGVISTQFIVTQGPSRFVVFLLSTVVDAVLFMGLYELLGLRQFSSPIATIAGRGLANAVVGVLAFKLVETFPSAVERHRASKAGLRR